MRMPGYPSGVPSQYAVHYHPWPTRFHGPLYQRPVFNFPWMRTPQNVFKPGDFYPEGTAGVGDTAIPATCPDGCAAPGFLGSFKPSVVFIGGALFGAGALWLVSSILYERGRRRP